MPARLLTPDSIWNSFLNSNKRHLLITGTRGIGKTTLLNKLFCGRLPRGITTYAIRQKAVYMRENGNSNDVVIGVYDDSLPTEENKMRPCTEVFATYGTALLKKLAESDDQWISVDEIGFLETQCPEYCNTLEWLMEQKRMVAVVRKQSLPFLKSLCNRKDVFLVDLDDPFGNISCVIMASGLGKRFGGNKLMADFNGKPMILRAIETTANIFAKRVVITRHKEVANICDLHGVECVLHDLPHRSDTIRLGIEFVSNTDACIFCPGDQPLLKQESIVALALASKNSRDDIWRLSFEKTQGSPVFFPKWLFENLASLPQGKGGGFLANQHAERIKTINAQNKFELLDVDTPEDLAFLQKQQ